MKCVISGSDQVSQIGWASSGFESCNEYTGTGVGDDKNSYAFDGKRVNKRHDGSTKVNRRRRLRNVCCIQHTTLCRGL